MINNSGKYDMANKVESIARQLVEKFGIPGNYEYYCKIAYKLSEAKIWNNYEKAKKGRDSKKLFTFLCEKDMANH